LCSIVSNRFVVLKEKRKKKKKVTEVTEVDYGKKRITEVY